MTTQPDIDSIAREAAEQIDMQIGDVRCDGSHPGPNSFAIIGAAIRRAQGETYPNLFQELSRQITEFKSERDAAVNGMLDLKRTNQMLAEQLHKHAEAIAERDALEKVAKAADQLEAMLGRNCGSNDDWPISLKVSGDCAQELAGKLTALTRALKPYRKAKNDELTDPAK